MNNSGTDATGNGDASNSSAFTLGARRCVSYIAFAGVLYCGKLLAMAACICPGEGIAMCVCSAIAVVCGPVVLRIIGTLLLALSIFITVDMVQRKAAQDEEVRKVQNEYLKLRSPKSIR